MQPARTRQKQPVATIPTPHPQEPSPDSLNKCVCVTEIPRQNCGSCPALAKLCSLFLLFLPLSLSFWCKRRTLQSPRAVAQQSSHRQPRPASDPLRRRAHQELWVRCGGGASEADGLSRRAGGGAPLDSGGRPAAKPARNRLSAAWGAQAAQAAAVAAAPGPHWPLVSERPSSHLR